MIFVSTIFDPNYYGPLYYSRYDVIRCWSDGLRSGMGSAYLYPIYGVSIGSRNGLLRLERDACGRRSNGYEGKQQMSTPTPSAPAETSQKTDAYLETLEPVRGEFFGRLEEVSTAVKTEQHATTGHKQSTVIVTGAPQCSRGTAQLRRGGALLINQTNTRLTRSCARGLTRRSLHLQ